MVAITLELGDEVIDLLSVLGEPARLSPRDVISVLIGHACQGVYRPGAWEREWIEQAFGPVDQSQLEPDPDCPGRLRVAIRGEL